MHMAKIVQINKCPNCFAKLEHVEGSNKLVCEYCGAEFNLEDVEKEEASAAKENASEKSAEMAEDAEKTKKRRPAGWGDQDWFDTRVEYTKLCTGEDTRKMMKTFVKCINDLKTPEKIIKFIRTDIDKGGGIGMAGFNEDKLKMITEKAKKVLEPGETPIIYANSALLSNGKKGMLITDKRTVVVKSSVNFVKHDALDYICFDTDDDYANIYLNGNSATELNTPMSADSDLLGAMIALACAYSFEMDPDREQIIIKHHEDYEEFESEDDDEY